MLPAGGFCVSPEHGNCIKQTAGENLAIAASERRAYDGPPRSPQESPLDLLRPLGPGKPPTPSRAPAPITRVYQK